MFFQPKWKHKDWRVRNQAVKWIDDNVLLTEIAKSDSDWHVRYSATEKILDETTLAHIAKHDDDPDVRSCAIEKINRTEILEEIAIGEKESSVRTIVNKKLGRNDQKTESPHTTLDNLSDIHETLGQDKITLVTALLDSNERTNEISRKSPVKKSVIKYYIGKHWRGENGLGQSIFVSCILVTGSVILIITILIQGTLNYYLDVRNGFSLSEFLFACAAAPLIGGVFTLIAHTWGIVGAWRAANKRKRNTGKKALALVAKSILVLQIALVLRSGIGHLAVATEVIRDPLSNHMIWTIKKQPERYTLTVDNEILNITGRISWGLNLDAKDMLEKHPNVKVVQIESNGGSVLIAQVLAGILEERGISTLVSGTCASACTYVFLGGKNRTLHPTGRLLFHGSRLVIDNKPLDIKISSRPENIFMGDHGIPYWFIEKATSTPIKEFWEPAHSVLLETGFVTAISSTPNH